MPISSFSKHLEETVCNNKIIIIIKQLKLYGHVQRIGEGRLPKQAMTWYSIGRKRKSQKTTWINRIWRMMREIGL